ncbi:hypothetical protein BpHYR1_001883 [Brachionus plicatilis]|uniref:Uncharacterized protein n=1 Tax=Brachionus plicatilis TaxID=10195 RepID=A0A3M7SIS4_BRAPC|nr:hypothetical protein BpHYR1_001883 [Brachionus plicatilis]
MPGFTLLTSFGFCVLIGSKKDFPPCCSGSELLYKYRTLVLLKNLWTGQNKNSNAGLQFANTNELFNGSPEKVRQDYLEKSAIKTEPRNKWRNDDQIGFSGNSRGRSFLNTVRYLYSSSEPEQHGENLF